MMYRLHHIGAVSLLLALLLLMTALSMSNKAYAAPPEPDLLLLYDYGPLERNQPRVAAICRILSYMAVNYETATLDAVEELADYREIILVADPGATLPADLARDLRNSKASILVVGPTGLEQLSPGNVVRREGVFTLRYPALDGSPQTWLTKQAGLAFLTRWEQNHGGEIGLEGGDWYPLCAEQGRIASIPWFDETSQAQQIVFASLLTQWRWPYENAPPSYSAYLILDNVYPFEDPAKMLAITDMLEAEGVPYAINLMPLYDNGHFPAMKRFCDYLRYAQSRGAAMILRTPLSPELDHAAILDRMETAYEGYSQYGVYPLALAAPESYLFHEEGLAVLRPSRTVVLLEDDAVPVLPEIPPRNPSYADGHQIIAPAYRQQGPAQYSGSYSTALYLDIDQDLEALRAEVRRYRESRVPLRSLWNLTTELYIGHYHFSAAPGGLPRFNGEVIDLAYEPFAYEEEADFDRGFMRYLTDQLQAGNRLILVVVAVASSIFIGFIILARRRIRREFLRRDEDSH